MYKCMYFFYFVCVFFGHVGATVLVFVGVVVSLVFAAKATPTYSFQDLACLFMRLEFEVYGVFICT